MDRSQPSLIPEWLKGSGSGGTASSSLHSDDHVASKPLRNKLSVSINDHDVGRSFVSDRTTSSYFRRSSSTNGSAHTRSHGSFGRSNRDRDREKEIYDSRDKEKSILGDHRRREYSDSFEILPSRFEKDLRRSQSMITGKRGETWPRKVPADSSNANKSNLNSSNGLLVGSSAVTSVHKASFEREFPSLGAEERQGTTEMGRVSSRGLSTAIQSLPIGSAAVIGGDGWTSALAEVPVLSGSNGTAGSAQQPIPSTSASLATSAMTGLNMAETLAQGPSRAQTPPQLSAGTHRLEELAIKQSRQLVPMTPSMSKALVLNSSDKPKPKIGQQQHQALSSPHANQSPRSGPVKSDVSRTSSVGGKLHVLKPARERNGVSPTAKDSLSPTSVSGMASSPAAAAISVAGSAPLRSPSNSPNLASAERKPALTILEKRPTPQAQSRNDFFKLMRKKSMTSPSSAASGPGTAVEPSYVLDKSEGIETGSVPVTPRDRDLPSSGSLLEDLSAGNTNDMDSNRDTGGRDHEPVNNRHRESVDNQKGHSCSSAISISEEEEFAFLRSLGWEENAEDDEGLTEEEISSFYKEYFKLKPYLRIFQEMQPKFLVPPNPCTESVGGGTSSGLGSSDSKFES